MNLKIKIRGNATEIVPLNWVKKIGNEVCITYYSETERHSFTVCYDWDEIEILEITQKKDR